MPSMRIIKRLFVVVWSELLQYRGDLVVWTLAIAITPLVSLAIWYTVATANQINQSPRDMVTYYVMVTLLGIATASWQGFELIQGILTGSIVRYLIRPVSIFWEYSISTIVTKSFQLALPLIAFGSVLASAPQLFSPEIFEAKNLVLFIPSILCAVTLSFIMDMVIGTCAFWLEDAHELQSYRFLLMQVASGILIPFSVMPTAARAILGMLPFRYIVSAPVEILLGQTQGITALALIGYQTIWVGVFLLLLRTLWKQGLKIYALPGQ